jgi:uncharacterized protein (TIGR02300 family)
MSKPTLGTKRVCPSCAARFYDLGRSPITCSVCQAVYPVTPPASSRRSTRAAPAEEKKPEVVEADPPVSTDADVISLDEAAEAEKAAADEVIGAIGDDEDIPDSDDDDDTFLEQEEEGETDVAGIVGGGAKEES